MLFISCFFLSAFAFISKCFPSRNILSTWYAFEDEADRYLKMASTVREFLPDQALNYQILEDYVYWTMSYGALYCCGPKGCKDY